MKKRVLSVLLVIALLVTVGIIAAQADGTTPSASEVIAAAAEMTFPTDGSTYDAPCPHCGGTENVQWKPLSGTTGALFGGHYYVDAETVERNTVISAYYGEVCLHLNGNAINTTTRGVFETSMYGINVFGDGTVTTDKTIFETVKFDTNVYGGTYSTTAGSIVALSGNANFNIYGGEFGNTTAITLWSAGSFNVYGGEIASPTLLVPNGDDAIVNVSGGAITGAGVSMNNGTINVTDGEVSLITRTANTDAINVSGTAKINNLNLSAGSTLVTVGEMTDGAKVTVTVADGTVFTNEGVADYAKYFASSKDGLEVVADETGALKTAAVSIDSTEELIAYANNMTFPTDSSTVSKFCPACEANVEWKPLSSLSNALANGHYYVDKEHLTRTVQIASYHSATTIHLNNNTLESTGEAVFCGWADAAKTMTFLGNGNVIGTGVPVANCNATTFDIYGGTYTSTTTNVVRFAGAATINFYAGQITSGTAEAINLNKGTFNMKGGSVTAGNVNVNGGTLSVEGGQIATVTGTSGTINVSGAAKITTLDLSSGLKLNTVALSEGAAISVKADGAFTTGDAAASAEYFTALNDGHSILTDETTGVLSSAVYVPTCDTPEEIMEYANSMTFPASGNSTQYCPVCNETVTWTALNSSNLGNILVQSKAHYFVAEDNLTRTGYFFALSADACLHLNGKTLGHANTSSNNMFINSKTINIMGGGTVSSDLPVFNPNGGTLNIYGGTYNSPSAVNMRANAATNVINVYDATLTGGILYNAGTLNLSGAVKIDSLTFASGVTLGTLALTEGSEIGITAEGAFTGAGNAAYMDYFKPATGYTVSADAEGVLSCAVKTYTIDEVAAYAETMKITGTGTQTAFCPKCNASVSWTELTADTNFLIGSAAGAHYYLSGDITRSTTLYAYHGNACIFFNGHTITYDASASGHETNPAVGGNTDKVVTLMGKGGITSAPNQAFLTNGGVINVCGGTYTAHDAENEATAVGGVNNAAGVLNLYAGTFNGLGISAGKGTTYVKGAITGDVAAVALNVESTFNGMVKGLDNAVITTTKDITVDIDGHTNVSVSGTGNVTALDSYSQDSFATEGYATFTGVTVEAADNFVKADDETGSHLYYYSMKVSGVSLKPGTSDDKVGLYYKGAWLMDAGLRDLVDVGVVISLVEAPDETFYQQYEAAVAANGGHKFFFSSYAGNTVGNGVSKTSVLVDGIMKESANADRYAINNNNGKNAKIYAAAFMMLEDGTTLVSSSKHLSVYDVLNLIEDNEEAYAAQESRLAKFYTQWQNSMTDWAFDKIGKEAE